MDNTRPMMRIGPYNLANNLLLAPMAGVTDRPFRILCRQMGAGMAVSEMVSANSALHGNAKTLRRLDHDGEPAPVSVQIVGAEPRAMALAARANVDRGAQIIDINMGCPAKKVCRVAAGSALLQDEALVGRILEQVVNAVEVPVTLKIRTGWEPSKRNAVNIARIAENAGIQALAVHGRTRACGFGGAAEYDTVRAVKRSVAIPVIANGDIDSPRKAAEVLAHTGVDGLMIGRAAQGRPWLFQDIAHYLQTGQERAQPSAQWVRDTLRGHLHELYAFYGDELGVRVARKHIAWYSKTHTAAARFRDRINRSETKQQQLAEIELFFDRLIIKGELAA
jgi:tRNA-dihydrouridine synthase B